ncbi:MAG: DegT/DnrJ/EryC1/StrS family aminotransferase [Candidatus Binatia bacterium]
MIPRVRPSYSRTELSAAWRAPRDAVAVFERELAGHFGMREAITFPYGRSAIHGCLRALDLARGEVVQPAYNCVVVAHATVLAGCQPVFVDVQASDPNQDADQMLDRVGPNTVAVVPTSMFGLSFDASALCEAIRRRNSKALILIDCCQAFDARWQGTLLAEQGDAAILAFGIGKPMTTLFGGALLTNSEQLANAVRRYRDATFQARPFHAVVRRWLYFLSTWLALSHGAAAFTDFLENADTPLHRYLRRLRARESIQLPGDNRAFMLPLEAAIGRIQLRRVGSFLRRRREIADIYDRELRTVPGIHLLDWPEGSSYAIYAARVDRAEKRAHVLAALRAGGVQGDTTLSYVVPGLACYRARGYDDGAFPNAVAWSRTVFNLPNHPLLTNEQALRCTGVLRASLCGRDTQ